MKILVLREKDIRNVFSMKDAIQADKDAMGAWTAQQSIVPLRISLPLDNYNGASQYMPALDLKEEAVGIKIVAFYPDNPKKGLVTTPSMVVMVDASSGYPQAILDGTFLTRLRTGAISGAATDLLAKKDCGKFVLFGTGGQAATQLEAVLTARPMIEQVEVVDLDPDRQKAFCENMTEALSGRFKAKISCASSPEKAVGDADVITTVTPSPKPVLNGEWLPKGVHINGVGFSSQTGREIDEGTVVRADKIFVDTFDGVLNEVGDIKIPVEENKIPREKVNELGEFINGTTTGRETDDQITLFKTVGFGGLDVVTGKRIVQRALEQEGIDSIEL